MNRLPLLLLAGLVFLSAPSLAADSVPVKAKVELTQKRTWNVELLGRDASGLYVVREEGKQFSVGLPAGEFIKLEFPIDLEALNVDELYAQGDFKAAAAVLEPHLRPCLLYLPLPTNLVPPTSLYLKCLYWDGQYEKLLVDANFLDLVKEPAIKREGQLYRVLAMLGTGRPRLAQDEIKNIGAISRKEPVSAVYDFAMARVLISLNKLTEAQEAAAAVVGFHPRDFEWLPAGLLLTAETYGRAGASEVAEQILSELTTAYPLGRWAKQAGEIRSQIPQWKEELARKAAAAKLEAEKKENQ